MKTALAWIAGVILFLALLFGLQYWDLINFGFFAPKYAKVERHIFENTPSYVQGKIQDLADYKYQYDTTKNFDNRTALEAVIRNQFANFNANDCPEDLKAFLRQIRGY